eukprot:GFYU01001778.1.p1 GENE.GFYU01001778.1~~GFYU01001778.1.p1  ORF type:complete len:630 (-),score=126.29 GFYU01001778.1:162-2051(-)
MKQTRSLRRLCLNAVRDNIRDIPENQLALAPEEVRAAILRALVKSRKLSAETLAKFSAVQELDLSRHVLQGTSAEVKSYPVDNRWLLVIATKMPELKILRLYHNPNHAPHPITEDAVSQLACLQKLETLSLRRCESVTLLTIESNPRIFYPQLVEIDLSETNLKSNSLKPLSKCKMLKSLNVAHTKIGSGDVEVILTLSQLERLDVSGTDISEKSIRVLAKQLPMLKLLGCWKKERLEQSIENELLRVNSDLLIVRSSVGSALKSMENVKNLNPADIISWSEMMCGQVRIVLTLAILKTFADDIHSVRLACTFLLPVIDTNNFVYGSNDNKKLWANEGGFPILISVIRQYEHEAMFLKNAMKALRGSSFDYDPKCISETKSDWISTLITVGMRHTTEGKLCLHTVETLAILGRSESLKRAIVQGGGIELALKCVKTHYADRKLMRAACGWLSNLCGTSGVDQVKKRDVILNGGMLVILRALQAHREDDDILKWVLRVWKKIGRDIAFTAVCGILNNTEENRAKGFEVLDAALDTLYDLLCFGEETAAVPESEIEAFFDVMENNESNFYIIQACLSILCELVEDESNKTILRNLGAELKVVKYMKLHPKAVHLMKLAFTFLDTMGVVTLP